MSVKNLLNRIQELGYRFELISNDTLKFSYVKDGETPKEAIQILRQVKEWKQEVIRFLQQQSKPELQKSITEDQFTQAFNLALSEISQRYIPGAITYIRKTFPKIYEKSIETENRLNRLWNEGADINTFNQAINEWWDIELELIRLFQNKQS